MPFTAVDLIRDLVGLAAGAIIGLALGTLQQIALRRDEQPAPGGGPKSGWWLLPPAVVRLVFLVSTLALLRLASPQLFAEGTRWIVTAGVLLAYGAMLFGQLRRRLRAVPPRASH